MNDDNEFFWLVGLLEGEGCFYTAKVGKYTLPCVTLCMTDEEPVRKASDMLMVSYRKNRPYGRGKKDQYWMRFSGTKAINLMNRLRPHLCPRRQHQIDACIESDKLRPGKCKEEGHSMAKLKRGEV